MRILVTHPGRQHSHQTALALAEAGVLAGYWAGVPCLASQGRFVPRALWRRLVRYDPVDLPREAVRWAPWAPALRRLGDRLLPPGPAAANDLRACRLFDRWAARRLGRERPGRAGAPTAVIACEISALATFRAARRRGVTTILDAPSIHHLEQDRVQPTADPPELHARIAAIKDAEIALADHVLTVSELARQTYVAAGVPAERVHSVPLGADTAIFAAPEAAAERPRDGFTFLFAGAPIARKGFDLLLAAFAEVRSAVPGARLRLAGPPGDAPRLVAERGSERISLAGPLDQRGLAAELTRADCLVLPSRHDSFGMVVAEALAAGVPALVSEMVGAKDLVRAGESGWIVPAGDAAALAARMLWCARHPEEVRALRGACRRAAAGATWPAHHRRLVELLLHVLPERR
jgi:glycosyltransferase involved in cell wall biosynthesis